MTNINQPAYQINIHTNEGERFASYLDISSDCGADFYESGEQIDWQDNNGLLTNGSAELVSFARKAALEALAIGHQKYAK
jgi:hypothetical protein